MDASIENEIKQLAGQIKKQGFESLCFWLPTRSVGGGTYLFCELSTCIAKYTDLKVYYVDCPDGYAQELLDKDSKIQIIHYEATDFDFPVKEPLILFTNTTRVIQIKNINPKSKVLLWHWETSPVGWNLLFLLNETNRLMKAFKSKNAVIFHDWSSAKMLETQSGLEFENKNYFPVFLPESPKYTAKTELINDDEINIVWVGRLSHEKIFSVINIIDNFAKFKTEKIKRFHIIGDGLCYNQVYQYAKAFFSKIEFIFTGTIPKEELSNYLIKNADVIFAMGTAALEGASLSIPSVVVQLSSKKFVDDDFYWLYDTKDYCVGVTVEQKKSFDIKYTKFDQILQTIMTEEKSSIGEKSHEFFIKNFCGFEKRAKLLLFYMLQTNFIFEQLKKIIKYIPYNQIQVKSYCYKKRRIISTVSHGKITKYYLFARFSFFKVKRKCFTRSQAGNIKITKNISKIIQDGYMFAAEKFKG